LRVISGKFRGRKLTGPKGDQFRPTLDRVKESIFNVLGTDVINSNVLDLFCGSGSLGIEALSRGAKHSVFVDKDKQVLNIARKNVESLEVEPMSSFCLSDVFKYLASSSVHDYDIIFADPPYDEMYGSRIGEQLLKYDKFKNGGIFILERFKKDSPKMDGFSLARKLAFGQTEVDFYIREGKDENSSLSG
jgi:16S rRNA (guanine966-N2)-methyltransferase